MQENLSSAEVRIGIHSQGFKIDKTASAMNRYTKWQIKSDGSWCNPKPVCFHSLPEDGWQSVDKIDWQ